MTNIGITITAIARLASRSYRPRCRPLEDEERARYIENLREVTSPASRYSRLCFADGEPGDMGPRRVSQEEIRDCFADGWHVDAIDAAEIETDISDRQILAWWRGSHASDEFARHSAR